MNYHKFKYHGAPFWAMKMLNKEPWYVDFCNIVSPLLNRARTPQVRLQAWQSGVKFSQASGSNLLEMIGDEVWIIIPDTPETTMLILKQ